MRGVMAFAGALGGLIAQAEVPDMPTGLLTAATTTTILAWYLWYNVTRVLPEKDRQSQEVIDRIVSNFREEMRLERESHRAEVEGLRAQIKAERDA